ncbi:roadblock/LC7 domain-containing protein [Deinococcus cavernae]|uniref:Roadblock/LC7 domain-containing protein n=1 Tax=Deinococcus cavernae TaxID=2320857 RepID=A0A418V825_9DEIO|nr:roadblock/LC7 domain-containing protein [Deinococcus cavernae]RJF72252.1 roadblock/LC7 domain-containing protein [Deinococcus cavernae]
MTNPVYNLIAQALTGSVSSRAAETMLQAAMKEAGLSADSVTPADMQDLLNGPLLTRLSAALPPQRAREEVTLISRQLERKYPKAPTLFTDVGSLAAWDDTMISPINPAHDGFELSEDDFEFDDPDFGGTLEQRAFDLNSEKGQEELIQHLGRMQGVQSVMISSRAGQVLKFKAMRDPKGLSSVMTATALLFQKRQLKLMSVDLGAQTVCMRPLGPYSVAVVAGAQVNVGRLLAELQQVEASA